MMIWDAFTPVLSVVALRSDDASASNCADSLVVKANDRFLFGSGCNLDEIEWSNDKRGYILKWRCKVFDEKGCNINGCIIRNDRLIIVYGDKSLGFVTRSDDNESARMRYTFHFDDWIQTAKIVDERSLVLLFTSNTIVVYALNESEWNGGWMIELSECKRIRSSHKAVLLNSLLDGNSWSQLRVVVGTVMGDILMWYPSEGSDIAQRFIGHTGMIFGMVLEEDCTKEYLYSISDDRSLRLWSVKRCIQLDQVYGHLARPFAICNVSNRQDISVITAGQDGDVCLWKRSSNDCLSLLRRIRMACGSIRTLFYHRNTIILANDYGLKCALAIKKPTNSSSLHRSITRLIHSRPIRSFAYVSSTRTFFILDSAGILLSVRGNVQVEKVLCCEIIKHDYSLLLSPSNTFMILSSQNTLFVVDVTERGTDNGYRWIVSRFSERIVSVLWIDEYRLMITSESGLLRICEVVPSRGELSESGRVWLARGEEANAVCEYDSKLFVGTRKGLIVIIDGRRNKIIHIERYCHGKQSISDILVRYPTLYSVGRDGKLLIWKVVEQYDDVNRGTIKLDLIQRRTPSFWLDMEWPCNFIRKHSEEKTFWIGGFHGKKFVLVDYENGYELCEVNCGGGHRKWQFVPLNNEESGNDARFMFISKGVLLQIDLTLTRFDLISSNAHTSQITAVCCFTRGNSDATTLVTSGIDTHLVLSTITFSDYASVVFRTNAHTSSIYALSSLNNFLVSVGGKSEIFLWKFENSELIQLYRLRLKGDARLISVHLTECQPNLAFVISASDSRLQWYRLKEDRSGIESCISLSSILRANHQTSNLVITKLKCILSTRSIHTLYAITTSGLLMIFEDILTNPYHYRIHQIQKAGLSALDVITFQGQQLQCVDDKSILVSIGSESGRVHVMSMQSSPINQPVLKHIDWHGTTCTDIRLHESAIDKSTKVISISLDCRLAVFSFSQLMNKIELHRALTLNVSDPSSFCFIANQRGDPDKVVIVGSCLQIVPFDDLFI